MPNKFKYNATGSESNAIIKGDWAVDLSPENSGGGPSNSTGLYAGPIVPTDGYVVFKDGGAFTVNNDSEFLEYIDSIGGDASTVDAAKIWAYTQNNIVVVDREYDAIAGDGLIMNFDPSFLPIYSGTGTTLNVGKTANNASLLNGPAFNSDGTFTFDGADDKIRINPNPIPAGTPEWTVEMCFKPDAQRQQTVFAQRLQGSYSYGGTVHIRLNSDGRIMFIGTYADALHNWYSYGSNYTPNVWQHVAITMHNEVSPGRDGLYLYINGQYVRHEWLNGQGYANVRNDGGIQTYIGEGFSGEIGPIRIYDRRLDLYEIYNNYNVTKGRMGVPDQVTDSLVVDLDGKNPSSYLADSGETVWNDVSGNDNHGEIYNGAVLLGPNNGSNMSSGNVGSFLFDGSNDYVALPSNFFSWPTIKTWSITLWFKSTQTNGGTMFGQQNTSNPSSAGGWVPVIALNSSGKIRVEPFWTGNVNNTLVSNNTLNDGAWHCVTTTFNNGTHRLYIDGVYESQRTGLSQNNFTSTYYYFVGAGYAGRSGIGSNYFSGRISKFNFYTKTLSDAEVLQNYQSMQILFA